MVLADHHGSIRNNSPQNLFLISPRVLLEPSFLRTPKVMPVMPLDFLSPDFLGDIEETEMNRTSIVTKTFIAAALAASATAAQAVSYNISNDQAGWLSSVEAMGPTTFGTGTFVGVGCPPGVACSDVAVNGLPGVSFATGGPSGLPQ